MINVFGCLDKLAWVWMYEKDLKRDDGTSINKMHGSPAEPRRPPDCSTNKILTISAAR